MPAEWQDVITECSKYTDNTGGTGNTLSQVTATLDKIWLLSEFEVYGVRRYANSYEQNKQSHYSIYADNSSRIKYQYNNTSKARYWWFRSPDVRASDDFTEAGPSGTETSSDGNRVMSFSPCFQIS
jgi:hypothetical protein